MTVDMEFEGKTVELAIDEACKHLGANKDDLKFDVLSHGSTGIFGLVGSKKARIRVKVSKQTLPEALKEDDKAVSGTVAEAPSTEDGEIPTAVGAVEHNDEEIIAGCMDSLQKIVDAITSDAEISVERNSHRILFNIKGGNAGVLIGKKGQTLEAIQYIIEKIANKQNDLNRRIQVDVEGYLKTRQENLERLASRLAQKSVRTGKPMNIGQMNPHDRRIVHLFLKNNSAVRTQSIGEGLYRKLIIFPRKKGKNRRGTSQVK